MLGIALVLLGGLLWAGWYVYNRGFTRKWRT
jgi:drug/metabolite transporter (DMT)-like permease